MIIVDLSFYVERKHTNPEILEKKFLLASGHFPFLAKHHSVHVFRFCRFTAQREVEGVRYYYRPASFLVSREFRQTLKAIKPDVIITHSFLYPVQLFFLLKITKIKTKIVVQHHAESPASNFIKRFLQKIVYSRADGYFFTSAEQASPFLEEGIIKNKVLVSEVMEGSTDFKPVDGKPNQILRLLWVGRLVKVKDPLTVLRALKEIKKVSLEFVLEMVFSQSDLLDEVQNYIAENNLTEHIVLIGQVPHHELEHIYNNADYFIAASLSEGSGIALCEAMACGCIPIVANIPSFRKMTNDGSLGYMFSPGDRTALAEILCAINRKNVRSTREMVRQYFVENLSFDAIALRVSSAISAICK